MVGTENETVRDALIFFVELGVPDRWGLARPEILLVLSKGSEPRCGDGHENET